MFEDKISPHFEERQRYYQWAREMVAKGVFQLTVDKIIWEAHAEGWSQYKITPLVGLERSYLSRKIKKIERYLKEQTSSR